ncbi:unnamed protein product [Lymnaea stagnalis]|uniref:Uncharacterized protein n=1 Tax=Lymnaea stagnalis TaxID=6523 RepID=A0AAV2H4K1_LYMST
MSFRDCVCSTSSTQCILSLDLISKQVWKVVSVTREVSRTDPMLYTRRYSCDLSAATNLVTCVRNFMLLDRADSHLFHFESSCDLLCVKINWSPTQTARIYSNNENMIKYVEKHGMCNLTSGVVADKTQVTRTPSTVTPRKTTPSATKKTLLSYAAPTTQLFQLSPTSTDQSNDSADDKAREDNSSTIMISVMIGVVVGLAISLGVFFLCKERCNNRKHCCQNNDKTQVFVSHSQYTSEYNDLCHENRGYSTG